jgi:hypothetical protein
VPLDLKKHPYRKAWQLILEPPDPATGEVKAVWDGPPQLAEPVISPDGSLCFDELPESNPSATDSNDLPPECRHGLLDLRANNPRRPVDWRWQMACRLAAKGFTLRLRDWHLYWAVRLRWALLQWGEDLFGHSSRDNAAAALNAAYEFYHAGSCPARWELEARILAGEPAESIGRRFELSPEAVDWYELLFFNVHDRLQTTGYIIHGVIRFHEWHMSPAQNLERTWKCWGYWYGTEALDEVLGAVAAPSPTDKDAFREYVEQQLQTAIAYKAWVAIHMLPTDDPKTAARLLKTWVRMLEIESRSQHRRQDQPTVNITANVQAFLGRIKFH